MDICVEVTCTTRSAGLFEQLSMFFTHCFSLVFLVGGVVNQYSLYYAFFFLLAQISLRNLKLFLFQSFFIFVS